MCRPVLQVYLFGGAVCSWKQASGDEVLYVRPDAVFDKVRRGSATRIGLVHWYSAAHHMQLKQLACEAAYM
jgi:hypothetical protein